MCLRVNTHTQVCDAPIVTINESVKTREALSTLVTLKIRGLPVVNDAGVIVANFSASDVRHLASVTNQAEAEAILDLPVGDFLAKWVARSGARCRRALLSTALLPTSPLLHTHIHTQAHTALVCSLFH